MFELFSGETYISLSSLKFWVCSNQHWSEGEKVLIDYVQQSLVSKYLLHGVASDRRKVGWMSIGSN